MAHSSGVYVCTVTDTATGVLMHTFTGITEDQKKTRHCERYFNAFLGRPGGVYRYEYAPDPQGAEAMEQARHQTP